MPRPARVDEPASTRISVRLTPAERADLNRVARDNRVPAAKVIREAVNEYVADYRERVLFRRT